MIHLIKRKGKFLGAETMGAGGDVEFIKFTKIGLVYQKITLLHPKAISVRITKVIVDNIATHEFMSKGREKFILEK